VVVTRIRIKKINEKKHLDYLENWYCPLERSRNNTFNVIRGGSTDNSSSQLNTPLKLNEIPFRKQVMAGF
jgi:hypothetical protein